MIITPASIRALLTGFSGAFNGGLTSVNPTYDKIATVVTSTSASNTYGWLGQAPALREWIGDRSIKDMQAQGYVIANKSFESTVGVLRTDIEDDNVGVYKPLFDELGRAAGIFPDELVYSALKKGISSTCFDGQNFFDTDHPVFQSVDGKGDFATVSNYYSGTKSDAWYLLDTTRALKPLIYQKRRDFKLTRMDQENDEAVFMRNEYRFGVDGRCNAGYGFWQLAACSTEDLTVANFEKVYSAMRNIKADGGRPLNVSPTLLVVPPNWLGKAEDIVKVHTINGTTNKHHNRVSILESAFLA